jgi:Ca2+-binding EF-hand superfamily protein
MDASADGTLDADEMAQDPARLYGERARWAADVIQRYDADDDDTLSAAEAPFRRMAFTRADADNDGRVDRRELTQFGFELALLSDALRAENPAKVTQTFLKKHDKNKDGKISESEFEWGPSYLARYDRNGDKVLDVAEIGRIRSLPPSPRSRAKELLKQRDRNGDSQLSVGEFGQPPEVFHAADRNADGQLSLDELSQSFAQPTRSPYKARPEKRFQIAPTKPVVRKGDRGAKPKLKPAIVAPKPPPAVELKPKRK